MKHTHPISHARVMRAAVILILATMAGGILAAPAQAAAYRFWGYFQLTNGAWAFASKGPAQTVPKDGSVEGWRFAVADESSTRTPRATPTFASLCAGVKAKADAKRVGLVIDYGRAADSAKGAQPPAARATCVSVPVKATGSDVLVAAGATLRLDKALSCAIDGWPATGCGEPVAAVPAAAAAPDTKITIAAPADSSAPKSAADSQANPVAPSSDRSATSKASTSSPWVLIGGLAAVVLIAGLGLGAWRRGRDAKDS